ncbi:MAG: phytase [Acidobacteria bacterium]|nr:phytase [Acidobacteriota bacterium]
MGRAEQFRYTAAVVAIAVLTLSASGCATALPEARVQSALATDQVSEDPDDPAIWVNAADPANSLILGTNKSAAPSGALVVFGLDGKTRQTVDGIDRPNNVDVEYGLLLRGKATDIAVLTERLQRRLRVFAVTADGVSEVSSGAGVPVFTGQAGDAAAPMGIALYKRPGDGAVFAIVGRKTGPKRGYLWQYRLEDDGAGRVTGTKVREFGVFSGVGEIEAIAVDDELGYIYYADEGDGIHKWHADPDHQDAGRELAHFGRTGYKADREGIAIYTQPRGAGYILCTDQVAGDSRYFVYRREGGAGGPHDHSEVLKVIRGGADSTDGLDATSAALGPAFPHGLLVAMNSGKRNFLVFRWEDVAAAGTTRLR